jgi:hypothetical protein
MEPITTILINAIVAGAVKGLSPAAEKAIGDAYAGFRRLIVDGYHKLVPSVTQLEAQDSAGRRATLAEDLQASPARNDEKLLAAARAVIDAAEQYANEGSLAVLVRKTREAEFEIENLRIAGGGNKGLQVDEAETAKFKIRNLDVGGKAGN